MTTRVNATYIGHRPDLLEIRHVFRDKDGPVGRELDAMSLRVLNEARRRVGVRTGRLLASIHREDGTGTLGPYRDIIAGVPGLSNYLGYHMFGTGPHIIRPRRRKALRFVSGGRVRYARIVHHPGTRPNPFLERALDVLR